MLESIKAFGPLVEERGFRIDCYTIFVTISPSPYVKVEMIMKNREGKQRVVKRPYGMCKQDHQYLYCMKCLQDDYIELISDKAQLIGIAEMNKSGNIHLHLLINDPMIRNTVQMEIFRRDVLNGWKTQQNIKAGNTKGRDWMNNIVYVNQSKEDIVHYFMKQQHEMLPRFPNYML